MNLRAVAAVLLWVALAPAAHGDGLPPLRVGLGSGISPLESYGYYEGLLSYVGKRLGRKVEMVQYTTYAEMDAALGRLDLDFAFVCSGSYVRNRARFGVELIAAPESRGAALYYSYLIVPAGGPATRLADLRGKRFAFTDPRSNTGGLVPTYLVGREFGVAPEAFFGQIVTTWSHDRSIDEVAAGLVDGASVDSLVFEYLAKRSPARVQGIRILSRSPPYGIPPFVATKASDPRVRRRIRDVLLSMHTDAEGKRILEEIMYDRFVVPSDAAYDSVRDMQAWVEARRRGAR